MNSDWIYQSAKTLDDEAFEQAKQRQLSLTKPPGSLGELETIACKFAAWKGKVKPSCDAIKIRVFAGDHGVCDQGISAFPPEVTGQMINNFVSGGAAISVLARSLEADFKVVNMGTLTPQEESAGLVNVQIAPRTNDFSNEAAMSESEVLRAIDAGAKELDGSNCDLFIGGEMGIGNTTSASAIYSVLLDTDPMRCVGPGTGLDGDGISHKASIIQKAITQHQDSLHTPLDVLQYLGGFEIAGLVGAYLRAADKGTPILVDGFICTAAALLATKIKPDALNWMMFSHQSAEPAHVLALKELNAKPILDLGMRLGEGSGAAVAASIIKSAINLHNNMATFADAGVSDA
ncbi:MAG: nicotinate-nucleotide--dimethylbenzimidazole phosphoribosyltransferase [Pseudomonadota bacterium]